MKIEFKDVSFGYTKEGLTIKNINFTLDEPGLVCIIGPNGVGKSTLVKMICKILKPTSGSILLNDQDIVDMPVKELSKSVGYVPPFTQDYFSMTVVDTVLIGRHNHHKWKTTDEDIKMTYKAMELVGVDHLAMRKFNELSAGQHQKVAIARGLVEETPILILDEPTSNLDVKHQVFIMEMLRGLAIADKKLIIMISHDLNLAARYSNKIILMEPPGVIRNAGTSEEVITEGAVRCVYGIDCDIITVRNKPLVILGSALADD